MRLSARDAPARRAAFILAALALHRRDAAGAQRAYCRITEKGGESLRIETARDAAGGWLVRLGGEELAIDIATGAGAGDSLRIDGAQFEADVDVVKKNRFEVMVAGRLYKLEAALEP